MDDTVIDIVYKQAEFFMTEKIFQHYNHCK